MITRIEAGDLVRCPEHGILSDPSNQATQDPRNPDASILCRACFRDLELVDRTQDMIDQITRTINRVDEQLYHKYAGIRIAVDGLYRLKTELEEEQNALTVSEVPEDKV